MAFKHRKLMYVSPDQNLIQTCSPHCTPNYKGCSTSCTLICQSFCTGSYPSPNPPPQPSPPITSSLYQTKHHKLSLPLIISLAIFATTFFIFCCYAIYRYYTCRSSSRNMSGSIPPPSSQRETEDTHHDALLLDEDHGPVVDHPIWYIRTIGLQQSIINSIAVCKYKRSDGFVEGTECSVCLSEFQEDETLRLLPKCNHAFHMPCIDTWLRSHTNCPMCRAGIVATPTVASPSPEPSAENSHVMEEIQEGSSENNSGFGREREEEDSELRIRIEEEEEDEEEGELRMENGLSNDEISKEREGIQPMRRSVSLDALSASMVSLAIANDLRKAQSSGNSSIQLVKVDNTNTGIVPKRVDVNPSLLRLVGSSSIGRSMKRSMSCSGKLLLSMHSRSRNSVLPQ